MDSSDDDWMTKGSRAPAASAAATSAPATDMDMLAARRQALRMQREAQQQRQQQQQQQQQRPQRQRSEGLATSDASSSGLQDRSTSRRRPTGGRLGAAPSSDEDDGDVGESSLPAAFLGGGSPSESVTGTSAVTGRASGGTRRSGPPASESHHEAGGRSQQSRQREVSADHPKATPAHVETVSEHEVNEAKIEELKRQVAAKKKLLQATREREAALLAKWRTEKAQKQAEIHQLDAKLRNVWAAIEDEKSGAEAKVRTTQDEHEREMRQCRARVEAELKATYEPQIAAAQAQLKEKHAEEERLKALLQSKGESEDLVNSAIAAALSSIVGRIQESFAKEEAAGDKAWQEHVEELVRHEVRSSFAVSAESEAQTEREELNKHFADALVFWRDAEESVRTQILKMDDALMADLASTVKEDLGRLQREQLAMEEIYVQSREAWAVEHQRLLQAEFDSSLRRREAELDTFRRLRDQLHVERMRDLDAAHQDRMAAEEELHMKEMQQLREWIVREEGLHAERERLALATQQDIAKSTDMLKHVAASCDAVVSSLKEYQLAVEEGRTALDSERRHALTQQEQSLKALQDLVAKQASSVEDEHRNLTNALSKLNVLQSQVEQQLTAEADWLTQQESSYEGSKEAWNREYRQWKALVQQERASVEERFAEALEALQGSIAQLNAEERDAAAEAAALERAYTDMVVAMEREIDSLKERESDLHARQAATDELLSSLEGKRTEASAQWQALQQERAELAAEREAMRREEGKLEQTAQTLEALRGQLETTRAQTIATADRARTLQHHLTLNAQYADAMAQQQQQQQQHLYQGAVARPLHPDAAAEAALPAGMSAVPRKSRLAQKVISELRKQLRGANQLGGVPLSGPTAGEGTVGGVSQNVLELIYGEGAATADHRVDPNASPPHHTPTAEKSNEKKDVAAQTVAAPAHRERADQRAPVPTRRHGQEGTSDSPVPGRGDDSDVPVSWHMAQYGARHHDPQQQRTWQSSPTTPSQQRDGTPASETRLLLSTYQQRPGSSQWSALGGQTFTNLVPFSDAESGM